jgi:phage terminase large subunit
MTTAAMAMPTFQRQTKLRVIQPKTRSQLEALSDLSPNLLYYGCWGSGKTFILAAKAMLMSKIPNNRIALIRRKRNHLKATTWDVLLKDVLPQSWIAYQNSTDLFIQLYNGTEIRGFGLDTGKDINNLASQQFGFIGVEEAREIREDQFDEQVGRSLRWPHIPEKFLQAMLVTNPDRPSHWINVRWNIERWKGYKPIKARMLTKLLPQAYLNRVEQLRGVFRKRYKDGLWVGAEGMVYSFDPAVHIIKRFPIPKEWERVVGIDWGFDNPFVCQWWAINPEGVWFLYREIYMTHKTVNHFAPLIKAFNDVDGIDPRIICDHDPGSLAILKEHKIKAMNAVKDRSNGQQSVEELFTAEKIFLFEDALVQVDDRLVESRKPWCTAQEFPGYTWVEGKDDMSHEDDHGMDDLRYCSHTRLTGRKRRRGRLAA